jgi:hypothetical protein
MSSKKVPDNVALWNSVQATDPQFTKTFNRAGGFQGTAINPCYVTRRLTELFGPVGIGWKFVIENEDWIQGHYLDAQTRTVVHVIRGHIEYFYDPGDGGDWYSTGPQFGQTTFVGANSKGLYTDEEAPKKSVTDCLTKCAVLLGFASDIHLGLWDGNKYINDPGAVENNPFRAPAPPAGTTPPAAEPAKTAKPKADKAPATDPPPIEIEANSPRQLADFCTMMSDEKAAHSRDSWANICKGISKRLREFNLPTDPYHEIVRVWLQKEADEFQAATAPATEAAPKKPRGRPKKPKIDEPAAE